MPQGHDTSEATIAGLKAVLGNFLSKHNSQSAREGGVLFLFRLKKPKSAAALDAWIDKFLATGESQSFRGVYRKEQLPNNVRLAINRHRAQNYHFYKSIIAGLDPDSPSRPKAVPPEEKALLTMLDPNATPIARSLSGGLLEKTPTQELVRLIEWCVEDGALPVETDKEGEGLLQSILGSHFHRMLSSVLKRHGTAD